MLIASSPCLVPMVRDLGGQIRVLKLAGYSIQGSPEKHKLFIKYTEKSN